jgi:hypothetical protein
MAEVTALQVGVSEVVLEGVLMEFKPNESKGWQLTNG